MSTRRVMIAKIHIAKKELALADDSYRSLLSRVAGKESSKDCDDAQLEAVLAEFRRLGFEGKKSSSFRRAEHAYQRIIYKLWGELAPYVGNSSQAALRTFVKRQTGFDAVEFLAPEDANTVTEGLKAWLERERSKAGAPGKKPLPPMRRRPRRPHR